MTSRLSPEVLALRAPLDAYAQAELAVEEAERGYRAAKNALESYQAAMNNGHGNDDSLTKTLRKEMAARREAQQRAEGHLVEAANWVRSVLVEATGVGEAPTDQVQVPEPISQPSSIAEETEVEEEDDQEAWDDVAQAEGQIAEELDPIEDLLREESPEPTPEPSQTRAGVGPDLIPEPQARDAEEASAADAVDEEIEEEVSFEALLRGEGEESPQARTEQPPRAEPSASTEAPAKEAAGNRPLESKPSKTSPSASSQSRSAPNDQLWADVLSEEGDDGLLPTGGGRTMMGAVVTACMLFGGLMKPLVGAKTPTLDRVTRNANQAAVLNLGSDEVTPIPGVMATAAAPLASGWTHLAATPVPRNVAVAQEVSQIEILPVTHALSVQVPQEIHLWNGTAMGVEPATMEQETQQWQIPSDRSLLGWHTSTAPCGEGVTVMGGHVSFDGMPGPLSGLASVGPEDVIECVGQDGRTHRYVPQDYLISSVDENVEDWYPEWEQPALLLYTCTPELDGSLMVVRFALR